MQKITIAAVGDIAVMQQPKKTLFMPQNMNADLFLANLEGPIFSKIGVPAEKPIRIRLPKETTSWLREMRIDAVSLANNHTLDWGVEGLDETVESLDSVGIAYCGAGNDASQAAAAAFLNVKGVKIAFLSWAATVPPGFKALDNRPGIAGIKVQTSYVVDGDIDEQPGTPPWVLTEAMEEDLEKMADSIRSAAKKADFVILAMHWGVPPKESSILQGPIAEYQAQIIASAVGAGAGIIIGHHCHEPLGVEIYRGVPVLYSLGNYIFHCDYLPGGLDISSSPVPYSYSPGCNESCFVLIDLARDQSSTTRLERVTIIPCMLDGYGEAIEADQKTAEAIIERIYSFSVERKAMVEIRDHKLVWEAP